MKDKLYLAVAYHKEHPTLAICKKLFNPIHVGKSNSTVTLDIDSDIGEKGSISEKNTTYCELTALYFMWKNIDKDYYGLMHYRRYFSIKNNFLSKRKIFFLINKICLKKDIFFDICTINDTKNIISDLTEFRNNIINYLDEKTVILPKKTLLANTNVKEQYSSIHNIKDYIKIENLIIKKNSSMRASVERIAQSRSLYTFNMFIMHQNLFSEYMEWLFDILFEFEKDYVFSDDSYNNRVFGFLSERMLNIFLDFHRKDIKIKELNIMFIGKN